MRMIRESAALGLALAVLAGCADDPTVPASPAAAPPEASFTETILTEDGEVELKRPRIDVTDWVDESLLVLTSILDPNTARNIGPGSAIIITIPGEGRFGCTANFVWAEGAQLYLGSAGHCFLPTAKTATHGESPDYDASGVSVIVCVEDCGGNFRSNQIVGTWVSLGLVAYARQSDPTGQEGVGNDFGVVEIPAEAVPLVRPTMPVWGDFQGSEDLDYGKYGCHYGNGLGVGEVFLTKARVGVGGGHESDYWMGDFLGAFGDSGSGMVTCESDGVTFHSERAAGVLTHLGVGIGDVKFKNLKMKAEHGFIFGTTIGRAVEMAREAGLKLALVEP
jgi:hypothetical protein